MSRAELLEKGETTADHIKNQREESDKVDQDKKNEHPREGGLFRGAFKHPPITQPIVDLEDNVIRCPQCGWELEDDVECEHCGYIGDLDSDAGDSQWSGTEENSEMADFLDEEAQDDFDGTDAFHGDHGIFASFFPPGSFSRPSESLGWRNTRVIGDSEDEDPELRNEYDDTDMESFIDDDEHVEYETGSDPTTVVGGHGFSTQDFSTQDFSTQNYNTQDHSTQDHDSHTGSEIPMTQEDGYASFSSMDEGSGDDESGDGDEEDDDDDEDPIRPPVTGLRRLVPGPNGTLRRGTDVRGRLGSNQRSTRSNTTGSSVHNTIDISDDSKDSDSSNDAGDSDDSDDSDEGPVAPSRRTRGRINGAY